MGENERANASNKAFINLGSFEAMEFQNPGHAGNVLKANQVVPGGVRAIELVDGNDDYPTIVLHREGERIESVEFICKCGRGTIVKREYNGG